MVRMRTGAKRRGKPLVEQLVGDDLQVSTGRWMRKHRRIDRAADRYEEVVTEPETGQVIHETREPLSDHRDHRDACPG